MGWIPEGGGVLATFPLMAGVAGVLGGGGGLAVAVSSGVELLFGLPKLETLLQRLGLFMPARRLR